MRLEYFAAMILQSLQANRINLSRLPCTDSPKIKRETTVINKWIHNQHYDSSLPLAHPADVL